MSMSGAKALSRTENGLAGSDFMIACFSRSGSLRHRAGVSAVGIPRPKAGEDGQSFMWIHFGIIAFVFVWSCTKYNTTHANGFC